MKGPRVTYWQVADPNDVEVTFVEGAGWEPLVDAVSALVSKQRVEGLSDGNVHVLWVADPAERVEASS